jgi:GT2 family glycosyltransferase
VISPEGPVAPQISVIVSTRDRARWLPECLRSLADQDCDVPFEVIVVDNGSSDETRRVIADIVDRDPRFRAEYEPRVGLSAGKNRGIRTSRAPILLFTDDDVLVDRSWISAHLETFARGGIECVGGRVVPVPSDLGPWPSWLETGALPELGLLDHGHERILGEDEYVWGANLGVRRRAFDRHGLWDETVGRRGDARGTYEDVEFQDRLRDHGVSIWFSERATVHHRVPAAGITPQRVLETAFTIGRNRRARHRAERWGPDPASWPNPGPGIGIIDLAGAWLRWCTHVILFTITPSAAAFSRARGAASRLGWVLEGLRGTRPEVFETLERATARMSRVVLRATGAAAG